MRHVVNFSGGLSSWATARWVADRFPLADITLLFADTLIEDEDLYRFLADASANIGVPVTRLADGRTPWEVFRDVKFIGNSRVDPCSKHLKREMLNGWHAKNCDMMDTIIYVGLKWDEDHRYLRFAKAMWPWRVHCPLMGEPYHTNRSLETLAKQNGLSPPRMYSMGFPHNNCGGFCVKAGQAQFRLLLRQFPERYAFHEEKEREMRALVGDYSILKDRRGGKTKTLTLTQFRESVCDTPRFDGTEWGGCGCAIDAEEKDGAK